MSRTHRITGHGGVNLFVRDYGPQDAPVLLLVHGWSQSSLCWQKQFNSDLIKDFRIIAPDLRGHGSSDKPTDPAAYQDSKYWAGDIQAIIKALELKNVLLAGWSMGAWIVGDYLSTYGEDSLIGFSLIGGAVTFGDAVDPSLTKARKVNPIPTFHEDPAISIPGIIDFVKACTNAPMSKRDLAYFMGFNMMCPPYVRKACRGRSDDYREMYQSITLPALLIHGAAEKVITVPMHEQGKAAIPNNTAHLYKGVGHAPFWEDAVRFNSDLAQFATSLSSNIPAGGSDPAKAESRPT